MTINKVDNPVTQSNSTGILLTYRWCIELTGHSYAFIQVGNLLSTSPQSSNFMHQPGFYNTMNSLGYQIEH